ncbi:hypothetical protein C446_00390 [Halobiforma nitratireducens JCM 10879]|uniref:Ig-like domain-containing protein n=2 Tax=Halobiforma nitratireducens TaxID=130048 RepID=M0MN65_9EURY|nr:hypothetical protein C446_00390 [Halobiforma nitratireducens JCM 10879]
MLLRYGGGTGIVVFAGCLGASSNDNEDNDEDTESTVTTTDGGNSSDEFDGEPNEAVDDGSGSDGGSETGNEHDSGDDEVTLAVDDPDSVAELSIVAVDDHDPSAISGRHAIVVVNEGDTREFDVTLERDGNSVLSGSQTLQDETVLEIGVSEPGTYETDIETDGIDAETAISVTESDCSESRTEMRFGDGGIETQTAISC